MMLFSADKNFFICASHKVMTNTLLAQNHYDPLLPTPNQHSNSWHTLRLYLERKGAGIILPGFRPIYLIVRNPLQRIESLYRNALAIISKNKHRQYIPSDARLELFRHAMVHSFNQDFDNITPSITQKLSFQQFILSLPAIFKNKTIKHHFLNEEVHTKLQSHWLKTGIRFKRILKMESADDLVFLKKKLHINMAIRANLSDHAIPCPWNHAMQKIMYQYYYGDFIGFNYAYQI